jgi:hypothetical protein
MTNTLSQIIIGSDKLDNGGQQSYKLYKSGVVAAYLIHQELGGYS